MSVDQFKVLVIIIGGSLGAVALYSAGTPGVVLYITGVLIGALSTTLAIWRSK